MESIKSILGVLLLASVIVFNSCSDRRTNFTTLNEDGDIVVSDASLDILENLMEDYIECKENETEDKECNHFTAEAICRFYEIDDFEADGGYVSYREIKDIVTLNGGTWEPIGLADDQANLDAAQNHANNGTATIAFDPTKTNHVAIILPGSTQKSSSWDLDVPNSASFFVHKADGYVNKALSYSFRSSEGIILYNKK